VATTTITAQSGDVESGSPIMLTAQCEGSTLELFAVPGAVSLGEVRVGDPPITKTFQLQSAGGVLTLAGAPALEAVQPNLMVGSASSPTTPAMFDLTVAATVEGDLADHILVSDTSSEMVRIPITGHAVTAAYAVPQTLDVGTFCINQPTTSSNLSLSVTGTATLGLTTPSLAGSPSPFEMVLATPTRYPAALGAGRAATVSLTPGRQAVRTTQTDVLTWRTDVLGKPTATTTVTATFIDSGGAIAPPALDFGKVPVHIYGDDGQRVTIQNCNGVALELIPPVLGLPFSIDSPNFPSSLNPGETATFSIGFHPNKLGHFTDTLTISSPQLPSTPLLVALSGDGSADGLTDDAGSGSGSSSLTQTSFYACSCRSTGPGGVLPIALAVICVLFPRRRRR
jgi:MYXO-CTERM domain-containing protein